MVNLVFCTRALSDMVAFIASVAGERECFGFTDLVVLQLCGLLYLFIVCARESSQVPIASTMCVGIHMLHTFFMSVPRGHMNGQQGTILLSSVQVC